MVKQDLDDANERCDELDFALQDKEDQFEKLEYELSSTHQVRDQPVLWPSSLEPRLLALESA